ncbi:hypothetical protein RQP46_002195 [Phenoliferia psychrophenolica]
MNSSLKRKASSTLDVQQQQPKRPKGTSILRRVSSFFSRAKPDGKEEEQVGGGVVPRVAPHLPRESPPKGRPFDLTSASLPSSLRTNTPRLYPDLFSNTLPTQPSAKRAKPSLLDTLTPSAPRSLSNPMGKISPAHRLVKDENIRLKEEYKWATYQKKKPMGSRRDKDHVKKTDEANLEALRQSVPESDKAPWRDSKELEPIRNAHASENEPEMPRPPFESYEEMRRNLEVDDQPAGPKRRAFPQRLSPEDLQEVDRIQRERGTVSSMPGAEVKDADIRKLKGLTWINDEIITFYAVMINNRSKSAWAEENSAKGPGDFVKAYSFTSFFWKKYTENGYGGVKRWSKRVDLFAQDIVLMPINQNNMHWVCAAINMRRKRFEYYDSLGSAKKEVYKTLRKYIQEEHLDKKKKEIDLSEWVDYFSDALPQQDNSSDCGVFTCQFMESLSRGVEDFDFDQAQMPYFRSKMALEIKRQNLILEPFL